MAFPAHAKTFEQGNRRSILTVCDGNDPVEIKGAEAILKDGVQGFGCQPLAPVFPCQAIPDFRLTRIIIEHFEVAIPDMQAGRFEGYGKLEAWSWLTRLVLLHLRDKRTSFGFGHGLPALVPGNQRIIAVGQERGQVRRRKVADMETRCFKTMKG